MMNEIKNSDLKWTHIHNHSVFSMKDGISSIPAMIEVCKKHGFPALAITDHGSTSGFIEQYKLCIENNIKPIFGCEFYINNQRKRLLKAVNILNGEEELSDEIKGKLKEFRDSNRKAAHIVLLAKNRTGYYNLLKIHNDAYSNGFYYRPQTDLEFISKNKDGLIATSACAGSEICKALVEDFQKGCEMISKYRAIFGYDDFYLELMPIDFDGQANINKLLIAAAKETNTKLIFTRDCHYIDQEGHEAHNLLLAIQSKEEDPAKVWKFSTSNLFMCSLQECLDCIKKEHSYIEESVIQECLENVDEIINKVELFALDRNIKLPKISGAKQELLDKVKESITQKGLRNNKVYMDRLKYELEVINDMGLLDYFYIVYDYVRYAKSQGIWVGPRGSASGCLLLFLLDVIDIDPIKYNLVFERFLNRQRIAKQLCLEI